MLHPPRLTAQPLDVIGMSYEHSRKQNEPFSSRPPLRASFFILHATPAIIAAFWTLAITAE